MKVLVVGAGIVGAACAEALAEAGARVRVLERARPAAGVTAAGMGHVLVLDDSPAQLALTRLSRELWNARVSDLPANVEHDPCGTIWVASRARELGALEARAEAYEAAGIRVEVLDERGLRAAEPNLRAGLAGGLRVPDDSVVYPPTAAAYLLERARAQGAVLETGVHVRTAGDGYVLLEDGTRLEADCVVVAAGLATPRLLARWLDRSAVRPKKGHLAITARASGFVRHQLIELDYLASAHGSEASSVAFNVQPRRTGQVLLGSSRQLDVDDTRVEADVLARMVERAIGFLPALARLTVVRAWTGLRPASTDNLPLIGALPGAPRLFAAAGHEGLGITTSLGTARLVADLALGRMPSIDPLPYAAWRCVPERAGV